MASNQSRDASVFSRIRCRLFGHSELERVALGIGRRREFSTCQRCGATVHCAGDDCGE